MAKVRLPAYVQTRKLASGLTGYYWCRPSWAAPPAERNGKTCPFVTSSLGTDLAAAIARGEAINEGFTEWRTGAERGPAKGTVRWLFQWYREQERFTALRHKTRKEYRAIMDAIEAVPMKTGALGDRRAGAIDATAADALYAKLKPRGERQAAYMMSTCRAIWSWALRHQATTGVKENPFRGMRIRSKAIRGNRATTRAECELFRATARAMGKQSMATAAALSFECCQRVWDVFGFVDPDGRIERGIRWEGYQAGERIGLVQSKTGNLVEIPLVEIVNGEVVPLYPELEEELARSAAAGAATGVIVKDERTGQPYTLDYMQKLHRRIRIKAGLPEGMTFTGFRHGGITEIGDSGEADVRAISGHASLEVTRIYNKANAEKARRIAAKRREHIAVLAGAGDDAMSE